MPFKPILNSRYKKTIRGPMVAEHNEQRRIITGTLNPNEGRVTQLAPSPWSKNTRKKLGINLFAPINEEIVKRALNKKRAFSKIKKRKPQWVKVTMPK